MGRPLDKLTSIPPPAGFTRQQRKHWDMLHRRLNQLEKRVNDPTYEGNKSFQLAEASAIRWALKTIKTKK